jgi:hypothetical protein
VTIVPLLEEALILVEQKLEGITHGDLQAEGKYDLRIPRPAKRERLVRQRRGAAVS